MNTPAIDQMRISNNKMPKSSLKIAIICATIVLSMAGMAYAAVPLYYAFCQATGYGGTTQRATGNSSGTIEREMLVRFDTNISPGLDWTVKSAESITDRIGVVRVVTFIATNNSSKPITGTAVFNVAPAIAGAYFNKIECFCFTRQTLAPGESEEMEVSFFLDPELANVPELDTVKEITLSYTFYPLSEGRN